MLLRTDSWPLPQRPARADVNGGRACSGAPRGGADDGAAAGAVEGAGGRGRVCYGEQDGRAVTLTAGAPSTHTGLDLDAVAVGGGGGRGRVSCGEQGGRGGDGDGGAPPTVRRPLSAAHHPRDATSAPASASVPLPTTRTPWTRSSLSSRCPAWRTPGSRTSPAVSRERRRVSIGDLAWRHQRRDRCKLQQLFHQHKLTWPMSMRSGSRQGGGARRPLRLPPHQTWPWAARPGRPGPTRPEKARPGPARLCHRAGLGPEFRARRPGRAGLGLNKN